MNTKASTIFFILFALALCSRGSSPVPEQDKKKPKADLMNVLGDLSHSNAQAVQALANDVDDFLSLEVELTDDSTASQLVSLVTAQKHLGSHLESILPKEPVDVDKKLTEFLSKLPTVESLVQENNGDLDKAKSAVVEAFEQATDDFLSSLHLAALDDWYKQVKTGTHKFKIVAFKTHLENFANSLTKQFTKAGNELNKKGVLVKEEFTKILDGLREKCVGFYAYIKDWAEELSQMYFDPKNFLKTVAEDIYNRVRVAAAETGMLTEDQQETLAKPAKERLALLSEAIALLTNPQDQELLALFESITSSIEGVDEEGNLDSSADYQAFERSAVQIVLNAMLPVVDPSNIKKALKVYLTSKVAAFEDNADVIQVLRDNNQRHKIRAAADDDSQSEIMQRIRNFDLLTYLSYDLVEEQFRTLVHNLEVTIAEDIRRLEIAQQFKSLLALKPIANGLHKHLLSDLYEAILYCSATIPEESLQANPSENFDKCLDRARTDDAQKWAPANYITLKMINLMLTPEDSTYQTTFPKLTDDDADVQGLFNVGSANEQLGNRLKYVFQKVSGDKSESSIHSTAYITYFSAKTLPAKTFSTITSTLTTEVTQHERIDTKRQDVVVEFVNANLREGKSPGSNKVFIDDKFGPGFNEPKNVRPTERDRVIKGEATNFVHQIVGNLPQNILKKLTTGTLQQFADSLEDTETIDNVEFTNVVVKVTRRLNPCHPANKRKC